MKKTQRFLPFLSTAFLLFVAFLTAHAQGNSGSSPEFVLYKYYNAFPVGVNPITQVGDSLGTLYFKAKPITGSPFRTGASIQAVFNGPTSVDQLRASLVFRTGATEQKNRMTISPDGLVGIGTFDPEYHLHVIGNTHTTGDFFGRIHVDNNETTDDGPSTYIDEVYFERKLRSALNLPAGPGARGGVMSMSPGGDSFDHQLFFGEDGIYNRRKIGNAVDWSGVNWYKLLSGEDINGTPNQIAKFTGTNSIGDSRLFDNGVQVGIGTSSPMAGFDLDINGRTRIDGDATVTGLLHVDSRVTIGTNNTPTSMGAINTSNYRLFVDGGILTEEVLVRTGWADYVFEKNYNLKPLKEVEQHIQQNGHLPGVPSARQVETEGLKLAENAVNQQVKIEELFLYVIELNKSVETLKAENAALKARIEQMEKQ